MIEERMKKRIGLTCSSKTAMPTPLAAPEPASPMKCPLPMLLANNDAPTYQYHQWPQCHVTVTVTVTQLNYD